MLASPAMRRRLRAVALLASIKLGIPTFMQPIVDADGHSRITTNRLTELYKLARLCSDSVRVLPQTHKLLGVR